MTAQVAGTRRRWIVPEVVQTSAMDCGPASLKCLLEGFGVPVSYGRLREACQTDVDGTSIDALELVANQLGVHAEQVMIPVDHLFVDEAAALPAVVVVRQADGATHFVVVWRRHGAWLQVMDPSIGRRWVSCRQFAGEVFRHEAGVPASDWRDWAESGDFLEPLRVRLARLGASRADAGSLVEAALADRLWFGLGALDATVRFIASVVQAGGLRAGPEAIKVLRCLFEQTHQSTGDIFRIIPDVYWSVFADKLGPDGTLQLKLRGAVLVRVSQRSAADAASPPADEAARSRELTAAVREKPLHPAATIWSLLKMDGMLNLAVLVGVMVIAAGAVLIEMLMFRGLFDIAWALNLPSQRLGAMAALIGFGALLLLIELPIAFEVVRIGRKLETRLRMALLDKLPHLSDRYFHSRPISDMAERSHRMHLTRLVPGLALHFLQAIFDLSFTLVGITLIDRASLPVAGMVAAIALLVPMVLQPMLNERDLRVRNHAGALHVFYLDALLGLVPIRTHGAESAVRRQHEGLLVEWARSSLGLVRMSLTANGVQAFICLGLAAWLLVAHFLRSGTATGADLLLVYWTLKLPAISQSLTGLAQQYPAQRNVLLRLLEPLSAPAEDSAAATSADADRMLSAGAGTPEAAGVSVTIEGGAVVAAGHTILQDIELAIRPGEHVAVVGSSGAGKSTLLSLLLGWNRLASGSLHVDGAPHAGERIEALRRNTAWVDPAIQIWNRPFLDNLVYACADDAVEAVGEVLDAARLRGVLQKLPLGLQTYLGEGGALLSGGEGQRVRLARALLQRDVRLALLDEPFRGLDRTQRHGLMADARTWWKDATLLCVTHDVAETLGFDRVLVVEGGRIVEDGSPARLAQGPSRYRELLQSEEAVRAQLWQGKQWRRIAVENGAILEPQESRA
jgi:ABC-type bacteriocin/lantibiotic exporter with double-glycine peptidase domain